LHLQQLQWLPREVGLAHLVVVADLVAYIKQIRIPDFINYTKTKENSKNNKKTAKLATSSIPSKRNKISIAMKLRCFYDHNNKHHAVKREKNSP